ncbi:Crp/Fnr family transcriptional regulator [Novosphingobium pentaromativorans]|uniref:Cyclic nucleotide-binding protein n=1 Tax=Novosphingobium pentaromativorans US6-1 TaxID=1088721 RepID=G6EAM5_9SPHN|nr:Crp/Fnr family transcriptional regulator [Novosphingobium pentaromativorans]AIT80626.1 cyclic nucleotide-binding protein [Novosphingobium pentaromativorans US6-1]EHJ61662.1 cyclic nucleotide-binding protein [Novosphingobium pentaromativorans US6-1]
MPQLSDLDRHLPAPLAEAVAPLARLAQFKAGQTVMGHQDETSDVFVILEGTLRIELLSQNGREITLSDAGPGALVGEFAALDDQPRSATVMATTKASLARIPGAAFREAAFAHPESAEWLTRRLVRMLRQLNERIFELNALAVRSRLHCELLRFCLDTGFKGNEATITPSPTHAELANRIGTHREAVTRELRYLAEQGITSSSGRKLIVCDIARLAEIVRAAAGDVELIQRANQAGIGRGTT